MKKELENYTKIFAWPFKKKKNEDGVAFLLAM